MATQQRAATIIQASYRRFTQQKAYLQLRSSVNIIAYYWRATLQAKRERTEFIKYKGAVVTIQSHFRRYTVQKSITQKHKAATVIQASFKGYTQRKAYIQTKQSANIIAYYWRATVLARQYRASYMVMKQSAITLQSHFRRLKVQRMMAAKREAAITIQAAIRRYVERKKYLSLRHSVQVIEKYLSATIEARACRIVYLKQRNAIITCQAHIRRRKVQRIIALQHKCATKIQSVFRCYAQRKRFLTVKKSVKVIECHLKATLLARRYRQEYLAQRAAVIICQSHIRKQQVQKMIALWNRSATIIQAFYRSNAQRKWFLKLKNAVSLIQVHWRATLLSKQQREAYIQQRKAAIVIQSHVRRRQVQVMLSEQHRAATIVQASFRKYTARKHYLNLRRKVSVITVYWRATVAARRCRNIFLKQRQAVILIQSHVRRTLIQRRISEQHKSATVIQTAYRCFRQRQVYLSLKKSVCVIGIYWRATLLARQARRTFLSMKRAAVILQSHFRRKQVQKMIANHHKAATIIQAMYRCHSLHTKYLALQKATCVIQYRWRATLTAVHCRKEFVELKQSAIVLQACVRRMLVQRELKRQHRAATVIQIKYRSYCQKKQFLAMKQSSCIIQCRWRATLASRKTRNDYLKARNVIICLQSHARRRNVQIILSTKHRAATRIQAVYRCHAQRRRYLHILDSIHLIQYYWRATLLSMRCRSEYLKLRDAVTCLQSHFRRRSVQKSLSRQHSCATKIQATFRCYQQKNRYLQVKKNAVLIQCWWRGFIMSRQCRTEYLEKKKAIVTLQSHFRHWQIQRTIASMHRSATVIQTEVRRFVCRTRYLRLQERLKEKTKAAIVIQRHWRHYQEVHYYERKINHCATVIQSFWRGYRVRRGIKSKAVIKARKRIIEVNRAAKECNKLMNRLPSMLDALLRTRYLSTVGDILKTIELITSVSEKCTVVIVEGGALPVLYKFIGTSNRSIPTLEVVKVCLQILNNVAKWKSTDSAIFPSAEAIVCLVDFMQKVYVNHPDIMLPATILLHSYRRLNPDKMFSDACNHKLSSMYSVLSKKVSPPVGGPKQNRTLNSSHHHQLLLCVQYLNKVIFT